MFKCKTSITGKTTTANPENGANTEQVNTKIKKILIFVVPLKYFSLNFWKLLGTPYIICKVSLILTWSQNCVLTDIKAQTAGWTTVASTNATFKIADMKLYVHVVTLSSENDKTLLGQLRF